MKRLKMRANDVQLVRYSHNVSERIESNGIKDDGMMVKLHSAKAAGSIVHVHPTCTSIFQDDVQCMYDSR